MTPSAPLKTQRGFSKSRRIRSRAEYQRIQESRLRIHTPHFIFILASRPSGAADVPGARLGLIVSRKVGNAVVRNRVKRLLREAFRVTSVRLDRELDLVVIARSAPEHWKLAGVVAEWLGVEERIKLLSARLGLKSG